MDSFISFVLWCVCAVTCMILDSKRGICAWIKFSCLVLEVLPLYVVPLGYFFPRGIREMSRCGRA